MSDDNQSGPWRRDKAGFRTAPGDRERKAYWWELVIYALFRGFWFWLALGIAGWWWWWRSHG